MLPDLLIRNARILTQDPAHPRASDLVVHAGRILAVDAGADRSVRAIRTVDARGATVVPGFNDVHAHSVWFGLGLTEANLSSARSLGEVYRAVADVANGLPAGAWVIASGFSPLLLGGRQPDRDRLDAVADGRPVWIKHSSGHACTLNGVDSRIVGAQNVAVRWRCVICAQNPKLNAPTTCPWVGCPPKPRRARSSSCLDRSFIRVCSSRVGPRPCT